MGALSNMLKAFLIATPAFRFDSGRGGAVTAWQATGKPMRISIPSMAIPLIESPSSDIGFEGDFTKVIRRQFVSHSQVPPGFKGNGGGDSHWKGDQHQDRAAELPRNGQYLRCHQFALAENQA